MASGKQDSAAVPSGVDLSSLLRWMDDEGLGAGPIEDLETVAGGTQNVMVRFARAGRTYVLRRGPSHLRARSNEAIRREIRILTALADTAVPLPGLIRACPDDGILGASFYLMEAVDGFNATVALPPPHDGDPALRHRMGIELADALVTLGDVDHRAVGLGDLGRPEGFLERQVPRWLGELESYGRSEAYQQVGPPDVSTVATWLEAHRPTMSGPGVLHGDFHLANSLFAYDGPHVKAIVDWEMATIGDPLLDLGWLVATWPEPGRVPLFQGPYVSSSGLARPEELVARYAARTSRDLSEIGWYVVLACFKLGIVLEGTFVRSLEGQAPRNTGSALHAQACALFEKASTIIDGDGTAHLRP